MTKLTLNKDFARRHLFVAVLMAALGLWFGYDGFIGYPRTDAVKLYRTIEGSDAPATYDLAAFKDQKIKTQYGFTFLALLAAALVGGHLWKVSRFAFAFDDEGFELDGQHHTYAEINRVDWSAWEKKSIVRIFGKGFVATLDAWHHIGVKDFAAKLPHEEKKA